MRVFGLVLAAGLALRGPCTGGEVQATVADDAGQLSDAGQTSDGGSLAESSIYALDGATCQTGSYTGWGGSNGTCPNTLDVSYNFYPSNPSACLGISPPLSAQLESVPLPAAACQLYCPVKAPSVVVYCAIGYVGANYPAELDCHVSTPCPGTAADAATLDAAPSQ